ncbi:MAG TPA: GYD domain-containing protein [candidate division Zixibacteria bacterium]|nr:GYD domain-containing protein [candidate division Zixibacteria bacterium]
MATYIMLTRLSPEALKLPGSVAELNKQAEERIKKECPGVKWLANYAVLGPCDYLDIFEAPDSETATKVALLIRSFGHATTETWVATPWDNFLNLATGLKG